MKKAILSFAASFLATSSAFIVSKGQVAPRPCPRFLSTTKRKSVIKPNNVLTHEARDLLNALKEGRHALFIAQTAPSVRVAFSEAFGEAAGTYPTSLLVSALRKLGFDLILDTNTAADLCITEEGNELLKRILDDSVSKWPLFTSCCPGWMKLADKGPQELLDNISTCKSPHMMYGAVIKRFSNELFGVKDPSKVYVCSVMPCVRKKGESDEAAFIFDKGVREVDNVITTKDVYSLLVAKGISNPLEELDTTNGIYDHPFQKTLIENVKSGLGSGAGQLFGATGGVMEAAVRSVYEILTKHPLPRLELEAVRGLEGVKEAIIPIHMGDVDKDIRVAVVSGLGNAKKLIAKISASDTKLYDFVEVMACPGGCINGGGQPRSKDLQSRLDCIYQLDRDLPIRRSHENPIVKELYKRHLGGCYGSAKAKEVLHVQPVYGHNGASKPSE